MAEKLSTGKINERLESLESWDLENDRLVFEGEFDSYRDTVFFANAVFSESEAMFHHPRIEVEYDSVKIELWTHEADGITEKDFELAKKIEEKMGELEG